MPRTQKRIVSSQGKQSQIYTNQHHGSIPVCINPSSNNNPIQNLDNLIGERKDI